MTTPYSNILCPVDFSDISKMATAWSHELASELDSKLTLLHAMDTTLLNVGNLVAIPNTAEELEREARRAMADWVTELDLSGASVRIAEGVPADVIVNQTEREQVDLLVMGTHGLSGIQKLLLGSVMEKVLHRVSVPLLSFSPRSPDAPHAPKNVLLAVDFGPETHAVVRHGVWLAEHFGAKLFAAHAVSVPYVVLNDRSMERLTPEQLERLQDSLTAERRDELAGLFVDTTTPVDVVSMMGSAYRAILEAIEQHDIDWVVMGRGGHGQRNLGWVGSTCHKLVRSAPCPILIVPE